MKRETAAERGCSRFAVRCSGKGQKTPVNTEWLTSASHPVTLNGEL